jgi:prolyl-tRNA synthetase
LQALAETHHDENGLTFPALVAPFDIYLLVIPGRKLDTLTIGNELYEKLQSAGYSVLYDDRDTRAGSKFKDADLIGAPLRITIGERGLKENNLEIKLRSADDKEMVALDSLLDRVNEILR